MKNKHFKKILFYFSLAILVAGLTTTCKKKDCNGPCQLLKRCANQMGVAKKEMTILSLNCTDTCAKYRNPVNKCYQMANGVSNECEVMAQCMYSVYKSGKY